MKDDSESPSAEQAPRRHAALGDRISRQRQAVFLTQAQLGEKVGVHQTAVARWESGESQPALRHRLPLCQALMIAPHILFASPEAEQAVAS